MLTLLAVSACSTRSFGKATPPATLIWKKIGYSEQMVETDLRNCQVRSGGYAPGLDNINERHQCMLNAGYAFDDNVPGYGRICDSQIHKASIGCKSMQGKSY